ncbi:hypothetical protein [Limnohabitans sp. INBF002]|uniref:hypothetical protein n=1 Tax=Limnohabitans sp. INBF002 TaxID=2986280 RepID=UPI00237792F2|nr:hypothetical protein [Limnohabitans sp. INBF002]BDU53383.1 hypothetical protein LINBF2_16180 [Limnohabitans sp. INBF002]
MKFTVKRETVVVTSCSFELDQKSTNDLINLLLTNYDIDLSNASTPVDFVNAIQNDGLEDIIFSLLSNCKPDQMQDTYKDGEEYQVTLV